MEISPDWHKLIALVGLVGVLSASLFLRIQELDYPNNDPTAVVRLGEMVGYQNNTADPCRTPYNYACGSYNSRRSTGETLIGETMTSVRRTLVPNVTLDRSTDPIFYDCVIVSTYNDSVYVVPIGTEDPGVYTRVATLPWISTPLPIYWGGGPVADTVANCTVTVSNQLADLESTTDADLIWEYYDLGLQTVWPGDDVASALVLLTEFLVKIGVPTDVVDGVLITRYPGCPLNMSLANCIDRPDRKALRYISATSSIQIPVEMTMLPFFNPLWPTGLKMATLGAVVGKLYGSAIHIRTPGVDAVNCLGDLFEDVVSFGVVTMVRPFPHYAVSIWAQNHCSGAMTNNPDVDLVLDEFIETWSAHKCSARQTGKCIGL
jgi:hypothetical protein